jgi:hypothetical protein
MNYWIAAFTAAVAVIIGFAAGPQGTLVFLVALGFALYLFWAEELGFKGAIARLGLDRLKPPVWKKENWVQFQTTLTDQDKLVKAFAAALTLMAVKLMLPSHQGVVLLVTIVVVGWFVFKIYDSEKSRDQSGAVKFN